MVEHFLRFRSQSTSWLARCAVLACLGWFVPAAHAQEWDYEFNPALKANKGTIQSDLRAQTEIPVKDADPFDEFCRSFLFPPLRSPVTKDKSGKPIAADLPAVRREISNYLKLGKKGPPYNRMVTLAREAYKEYLQKSTSRPVKYNVVLALGELNEFEATGTSPPKPLPAALVELVLLYRDESQPDYLRVAALMGIQRHAEQHATFRIADKVHKEIGAQMLALMKQNTVPKGRSPQAQAFLRRVAAEVLVDLGDLGSDETVVLVQQVIDDTEAPLAVRAALCRVMGSAKFPVKSKVDYAALSSSIGKVALDAGQREIDRLKKKLQNQTGSAKPALRSHVLRYYFESAAAGLLGPDLKGKNGGILLAAQNSPKKPSIQEVATKLKALRELTLVKETEKDPLAPDPGGQSPIAGIDPVDLNEKLGELQSTMSAKVVKREQDVVRKNDRDNELSP